MHEQVGGLPQSHLRGDPERAVKRPERRVGIGSTIPGPGRRPERGDARRQPAGRREHVGVAERQRAAPAAGDAAVASGGRVRAAAARSTVTGRPPSAALGAVVRRGSRRRRRSPRTSPVELLAGQRSERPGQRPRRVAGRHDHARRRHRRHCTAAPRERRYAAATGADRPHPRLLLARGPPRRGALPARARRRRSPAAATRSCTTRPPGSPASDRATGVAHRPAAAAFRETSTATRRTSAAGCCRGSRRERFDAVHSLGRHDALASIRAARLRRDGRRTVVTDLGLPDRVWWRQQGLLQARAAAKVVPEIDVYSAMSRTRRRPPGGQLRAQRRRRRSGRRRPRARSARRPSASRAPTILFSGAITEPRKGVAVLLEALPADRRRRARRRAVAERARRCRAAAGGAPAAVRERVRLLGVGEADAPARALRPRLGHVPALHPRLVRDGADRVAGVRDAAGHHDRLGAPGARAPRASPASCARRRTRRALAEACLRALRAGAAVRDRRRLPGGGRAVRLGPRAGAAVRAALRTPGPLGSGAWARYLITGAGGYVGGRLVGARSQAGCAGQRAGARARRRGSTVQQTVCDLVHGAAATAGGGVRRGRRRSSTSPARTRCWRRGSRRRRSAPRWSPASALAEACAAAGVRRLVYLSTVHVYGARIAPGATLTEDMRARAALGLRDLAAGLRARRRGAGRGGRTSW